MGWLIVIALCLLYFVVLGGAQCYLWIRMVRDGERPRWLVEASGVLACSPETAFALVGDPRNDAQYAPQVVAVTLAAPGELRAGATYRETIRIGPTTGCAGRLVHPRPNPGTRVIGLPDNRAG